MIAKSIAVTCALGAMFASNLVSGPASGPSTQATDPQVVALQTEVEALSKKVKSFEKFLAAQEKAGKALEAALTKSEAEGFTAGINPGSREILLKGLRAQAEAMQAGESGDDEDQPEEKVSMRGRRRGSIK